MDRVAARVQGFALFGGAEEDAATGMFMGVDPDDEAALTAHSLSVLSAIPGVRIIGPSTTFERGSTISFVVDGLHPHDVGQVLDNLGIAVRVGHHCAWPTCRRFGVPATTRISPYIYNDESDIDRAAGGIVAAQEFFGVTP